MFELFGGTISLTYGLITFCLPMGGSVQKTWKLMSDRAFFSFFFLMVFFMNISCHQWKSPWQHQTQLSHPPKEETGAWGGERTKTRSLGLNSDLLPFASCMSQTRLSWGPGSQHTRVPLSLDSVTMRLCVLGAWNGSRVGKRVKSSQRSSAHIALRLWHGRPSLYHTYHHLSFDVSTQMPSTHQMLSTCLDS